MGDGTGKMPDDVWRIHFQADRGDARLRLDQILVRRVVEITRMSRSAAQQWIAQGAVRLDGHVVRRAATRVREGTGIDVTPPAGTARRRRPGPEPGDLHVLYSDDAFIAVDKPPGIVVHPSYKQVSGTLLNALLWHARGRPAIQPGIVTRIDKGTSGIVVVAWNGDVHRTMQRDAAAGTIRKEYLAVVVAHPRPRAGAITAPLARDPGDRRRMIVAAGGAPSETHYAVVRENGPLSLVRCELVTGRTHQIRVHLASRGWPIVGDPVYGVPSGALPRPALHAWRITLPHPITRETMTIEAPIPADVAALLQNVTL